MICTPRAHVEFPKANTRTRSACSAVLLHIEQRAALAYAATRRGDCTYVYIYIYIYIYLAQKRPTQMRSYGQRRWQTNYYDCLNVLVPSTDVVCSTLFSGTTTTSTIQTVAICVMMCKSCVSSDERRLSRNCHGIVGIEAHMCGSLL